MALSAEVIESGVDYLTVTAASAEKRRCLYDRAKALEGTLMQLGEKPRPWEWEGYQGHMCGPLSYGWRADGVIARVSGPWADARLEAFALTAEHCSRLDLQVTARFPEAQPDLVPIAWARVKAEAERRGAHLSSSVILNDAGGSTLYIGARSSNLFGRLYDKWQESTDPRYRNAWRWEVETKRRHATAALAGLLDSAGPREATVATVGRYFALRGIPPPWHYAADGFIPSPAAPPSSNERRLLWLSSQVSPVVTRLMAEIPRSTVLRALGLAKGQCVDPGTETEHLSAWDYENEAVVNPAAMGRW